MELLATPFRLAPSGRAATVTDGTDAALVDAVARIVMTRSGELELVPAYGIPDPVFAQAGSGASVLGTGPDLSASVDVARVNACLATFGPPATVALVAAARAGATESLTLEVSPA